MIHSVSEGNVVIVVIVVRRDAGYFENTVGSPKICAWIITTYAITILEVSSTTLYPICPHFDIVGGLYTFKAGIFDRADEPENRFRLLWKYHDLLSLLCLE